METKPSLPPFTLETAKAKVQAAENAWNTGNVVKPVVVKVVISVELNDY